MIDYYPDLEDEDELLEENISLEDITLEEDKIFFNWLYQKFSKNK